MCLKSVWVVGVCVVCVCGESGICCVYVCGVCML